MTSCYKSMDQYNRPLPHINDHQPHHLYRLTPNHAELIDNAVESSANSFSIIRNAQNSGYDDLHQNSLEAKSVQTNQERLSESSRSAYATDGSYLSVAKDTPQQLYTERATARYPFSSEPAIHSEPAPHYWLPSQKPVYDYRSLFNRPDQYGTSITIGYPVFSSTKSPLAYSSPPISIPCGSHSSLGCVPTYQYVPCPSNSYPVH